MIQDVIQSFDLRLTPDGDFEIGENGDIKMVSGYELLAQHVRNRLENVNPDWFYDSICADLEDLIGLPNEPETAEMGKQQIINALSDLVPPSDIYLEVIPKDKVTQVFYVFIRTDDQNPMGFEVRLQLGAFVEVGRIS